MTSSAPGGEPHADPPTHYKIDRRPIGVVLLSRLKRQIYLAVLLVAFALMLDVQPPEGLTRAGWETLCVFALCATLWATSLLPLAITSLLAIALVPMLGILETKETYAYFGSKVVFFILGAFMLSAAMTATGLSKRLATLVVRRFGGTPRRLILSVFLLCAGASTVMSIHAVAVMMLPIAIDLSRALELRRPDSQTGRALFFALAWGCVMGGSLTVLGGGRGPLAIGILEEASGGAATIGFLEYSAFAWPMVVVLLAVGAIVLVRAFPPEVASTDRALELLEIKLKSLGKFTPREQTVGAVVVITVGLWAVAGDQLGLANIALCSMAALFALGTLRWEDVQRHVNWGIVVMYGGAICLGGVMERSGAAQWLTEQLLLDTGFGPAGVMFFLAIIAAVLTEFMSNSAVVAMLMPPALSVAETYGIDLGAMTMAIVLPSNFAFVFPVSTPVNAIAWSGGFFRPGVVAKTGLLLHLVAWASMAFLIFVYWPLAGLL